MQSVTDDPLSDDWSTIRIRTVLKQSIERVISSKKDYGVPRYNSVADFVHNACVVELDRMKTKKKEIASV